MSFTTATQVECMGANSAVGTALASSTSVAVISTTASAGKLPADLFLPTYGVGRALRIKAAGVLGTTSTPNLSIGVVANGTLGTPPANLTSGGAGVLATTGAVAQASSVTNVPWELEVLVVCATVGGSGTFLANGIVKVYTASTTIQAMRISSSTANPNTAATLATTSAYYLELAALWGTNSASNTIQCYSYTVEGLN